MQTQLVDRARRGDREAFAVLAAGAIDRLYAIARLVLRDSDLAEDATQDALVRAALFRVSADGSVEPIAAS